MVNLEGFNPETGEWNDSLTGDFIWGNTNIGEALSSVMTPFTWSIVGSAYSNMNVLPGRYTVGNICGRAYQNGSVMISAFKALGRNTDDLLKEMGGLEEPIGGLTIPTIPISLVDRFAILLNGIRIQFKQKATLRNLSRFLVENPIWSQNMRRRIQETNTKKDLLLFWSENEAHSTDAFWYVVSTAWQYAELIGSLRRELISLVGEVDTNILLSGVSAETELLASLGPVVGLSQVAQGKMDRGEYFQKYGHRGPYETEISAPRPAEDPTWFDQQLSAHRESQADVDELLEKQRSAFNAAWHSLTERYPDQAQTIQPRLKQAAEAIRVREATRSELARMVWVVRDWARRTGDMTSLGEDIFFLLISEALDLLAGKQVLTQSIPTRKETHASYTALPPYPMIISGQFDPFTWAADPNRPVDVFDSHVPGGSPSRKVKETKVIKGIPGSAGRAVGLVRRIDTPEEGNHIHPGEILVTSQTNIGWTLLFPRLAAVVTDVGAPLSHAAIVARELGIPAVVGCGDATARLKTGDRVRVDGSAGTVTLIENQ